MKSEPALILIRLNAINKREYNLHRVIMATVGVKLPEWDDGEKRTKIVTPERMSRFAKEINQRFENQ